MNECCGVRHFSEGLSVRDASVGLRAAVIVLVAGGMSGCVTFNPDPAWHDPHLERAQVKQQDGVTVASVVLDDDEAQKIFGVDLADRLVRAIWLEVRNDTGEMLHLLPSSLDENYFSQNEAAYRFHSAFKPGQNREVSDHFHSLAIQKDIGPGETVSGYVLVNRHRGGRYLVVELLTDESLHRFDFIFLLPDGTFDFEIVDFDTLYTEQEQRDVDLAALRSWAESLPCCTSNEEGDQLGDPLNVIFVSELNYLMGALSRSGWMYTERITGESIVESAKSTLFGSPGWNFPISPLYVFARHQDFAMQRPRGAIPQRNHMRLWMAPITHQGRHVWIAQLSRDIGIKPTWHSPFLLTHVIDPEVDEDRSYLLETLMRSQSVSAYGYIDGVGPATADAPRFNLTGDPYRTDGRRLVVLIAKDPVPLDLVSHISWPRDVSQESSQDPHQPVGESP
jgi:hypothetical protein